MNSLDLFLGPPIPWQGFLDFISRFVGMAGTNNSDDIGEKHVWHLLDLDLVAIREPELVDDLGIPFSRFSIQLDLIIANMDDLSKISSLRLALGHLLLVKIRSRWPNSDVRLIDNLQNEIQVG